MIAIALLHATALCATLELDGGCNSTLSINAQDLSSGGPVALLQSRELGSLAMPATVCAGTATDLGGRPSLLWSGVAGATGQVQGSKDQDASSCGMWVQVVDLGTCDVSEPVQIDVDGDGDGFGSVDDCDDANALVYPGALEICDGVQNDCDAAWANDDGLVTFSPDSPHAFEDWTGLDEMRIETPGTLRFCDGTHDTNLSSSVWASSSVVVESLNGSSVTTVNAPGGVIDFLNAGGLTVRGLTMGAERVEVTPVGDMGNVIIEDLVVVMDEYGLFLISDHFAMQPGTIDVHNLTGPAQSLISTQQGSPVTVDGFTGGALNLAWTDADLSNVTLATHLLISYASVHATNLELTGGLWFTGSDVTLDDSTVVGVGNALIDDSDITLNHSVIDGATRGWYASQSTLTMNSSMVSDNAGPMAFDEVLCVATPNDPGGFLRNTDYAVSVGTSLISEGCDWGVGVDDNTPADVLTTSGAYSFGDDASFVCDNSGCL